MNSKMDAPSPIGCTVCRVHTAKTLDANTLHPVGQPFRERFQVGHCLVVRASGLLREENCHKLDVEGPGYLLGTRVATTQAASGPPCPLGRLARPRLCAREAWSFRHVSMKAVAVFRALEVADAKACFQAAFKAVWPGSTRFPEGTPAEAQKRHLSARNTT